MNQEPTPANCVLADLYRLIEALDRRLPQLQRSGEAQIARTPQTCVSAPAS